MRLYVDLIKGPHTTGEDRGGSYIKRVVTGHDKDGSPQYRYLRTQEEVNTWEKNQSKSDKDDKKEKKEDIKDKVEKEHKNSVSLLVKPDDKKKEVKKSLGLFLGKK